MDKMKHLRTLEQRRDDLLKKKPGKAVALTDAESDELNSIIFMIAAILDADADGRKDDRNRNHV